MPKLHLEIITPERVVISTEIDQVTIPAAEGEVTILPEHIALFTKVIPGEIKIVSGKDETFLVVESGFLEVLHNRVSVLTNYAVRDSEVNVARVEAAKKRAEQVLSEKKSNVDLTLAQKELQRSILELKASSRRRRSN